MPTFNNVIDRADAAALIPEETAKEIIKLVPAASLAMSQFRHVKMSRKQSRIPVLSVLPIAGFVTGDTGLIETTEVNWTNKYLEAEEISCIVPLPDFVLDDSDFDIWGESKPLIAEAIGAAYDAAVFFNVNKPASYPQGIVAAAAAAGNSFTRGSVAGKDLADDINSTMTLVESDGFAVNGHAARLALKGGLRGLRGSDGQFVYQALANSSPATLYGEKLVFSENGGWVGTQADLITGDWRQGICGIRSDIGYKVLTEGVIQNASGQIIFNLAQQNMSALRVVFRAAFQVPNPVNRTAPTEANRYPFAVMRPVGYVG